MTEMESTDLQGWLGTPPPHQPEDGPAESQNAGATEQQPKVNGESHPAVLDGDTIVVENGPEPDNDQRQRKRRRRGTKLEPEILIELPIIQKKDEYELLPGHDIVHRVLGWNEDADRIRYKVKFKSGDKEIVSNYFRLHQIIFASTSTCFSPPTSFPEVTLSITDPRHHS